MKLPKNLITLIISIFFVTSVFAQTAVTAVSTTYVSSPSGLTYSATGAPASPFSGNTYTYNFGNFSGSSNNDKQLNNFTAGGFVYSFLPIASQYVKMRRVDNPLVSGVRYLKYDEGAIIGSVVNIVGSYDDDMERFFIGNKNFNSGTDNLFGNLGDGNGNNNNIERVDVIFPLGLTASDFSKIGFPLFERGAAGAHDPVKVAVILSIDGSGNPTSYSNIITISSANYVDVVPATNYVIARRDIATDTRLKASTTTNQLIGGVLFKFSDFSGVVNNGTIYGYSIIPNDFSGTSANLIDFTNATFFPTNTSSTTGAGGIDLLSFTGIAQSTPVLNMPISGNVFIDANGLTDGIVNGVGTNAGGSLFVHLLNSANEVVATVSVNSNGTYNFPPQAPGTYSIVLDTSFVSTGIPALPPGWVNTGEFLGASAGNDGSVNGILTSIVINNNEITNANFGIEQAPIANAVTASPQLNPGGTIKVTVPTLNGFDQEQGVFPGTGNQDTVVINTLPAKGTLYYDNIPLNAGDTIKNYDPSKLTYDPSDGAITVTFTYSQIDAALVSSSPAVVTMQFTTLLPIYLNSFDATKTADNILIEWDATKEINFTSFILERSGNGIDFIPIDTVYPYLNTSTYQFYDQINNKQQKFFYRLKMIDIEGKISVSKIITIGIVSDNTNISVRPNLFTDNILVNAILAEQGEMAIKIFDINGRVVYKRIMKGVKGHNSISIDLSYVSAGTYYVSLVTNNNNYKTKIFKR